MEKILEKIKEEIKENRDVFLKVKESYPHTLLLIFKTAEFNILIQIAAISDEKTEAILFIDGYESIDLGKDYEYSKTTFTCKNNIDDIEHWACKFVYDLKDISDAIENFGDALEPLKSQDKRIFFKLLKDVYSKEFSRYLQ